MCPLSDYRYWKFHFYCLKSSNLRSKNLWGVHLTLPPPPPLGHSKIKAAVKHFSVESKKRAVILVLCKWNITQFLSSPFSPAYTFLHSWYVVQWNMEFSITSSLAETDVLLKLVQVETTEWLDNITNVKCRCFEHSPQTKSWQYNVIFFNIVHAILMMQKVNKKALMFLNVQRSVSAKVCNNVSTSVPDGNSAHSILTVCFPGQAKLS